MNKAKKHTRRRNYNNHNSHITKENEIEAAAVDPTNSLSKKLEKTHQEKKLQQPYNKRK